MKSQKLNTKYKILTTNHAVLVLILGLLFILPQTTTWAATYYVDPSTGNMKNDGSYDNPWRTIEEVFTNGLIGTQVLAGDTVLLRDGYHGEIYYGIYDDAHNSDYITVAAQDGHTPKLKRIDLSSCSNWIFRGLTVSPEFAPAFTVHKRLVGVTSSDSHDVIIENCNIFSVGDASGWTESDWKSLSSDYGVHLVGSNMTVRNCIIKVFRIGMVISATNTLIERNAVSYIYEDGIVGAANDITLQYNTIKNFLKMSGHADGIQFHRGTDKSPMYNVTVRGNIVIGRDANETNPLVQNSPQGITNFDSPPINWVVENNIVLVEHSHGITIVGNGYGARNSRIFNNIVHNPYFDPQASQPLWAWISVGSDAENTIVRNNMSRILPTSIPGQNLVCDHNIDIDNYGPDILFIDHLNHDVRHKPGSPAIDAGSADLAPNTDILGTSRPQGAGYDIGAYEYVPSALAYGDVSGNGTITADDASMAARYAVGLITLTAEQIIAADVSGNGAVSATDASWIARKAVDPTVVFPVE